MADIFDLFKKIEKGGSTKSAPVSWLIVGLGNPGENYRYTRHNAGFLTVDALAESLGVRLDRMKFHALTAEAQIGDCRVLLMKPTTFMNNSGVAVGEAASFYKIAPEHILVISDDISLAPGKMRVRAKGSAGGHNGLKNIIEHLSSESFPRLRMGVGAKPHPDYDLADWVLASFPKDDLARINEAAKCAQDGIRKLLAGDLDTAVQICNSHKPSDN